MNKGTITLYQGIALYIGSIVGTGILFLPGTTAAVAGPISVLSWLFMFIMSVPIAYTFARLGLLIRDVGGTAAIVERAFGTSWSAIVGWFFFIWVSTGGAVVGLTSAGYLKTIFTFTRVEEYMVAAGLICIATICNYLGMRISGKASLLFSGIVMVLLIITIISSLPLMKLSAFTSLTGNGIHAFGHACVFIFWAILGWENITHLVPDFKHPERDVMRSTWMSLIIIGAVYICLSIVTVGTGLYLNSGKEAPLALLLDHALGPAAALSTVLIACIVCLGTLNVYFASSSRMVYAIAKENKFPQWFGSLSYRQVPVRSLMFIFINNIATLILSYYYRHSLGKLILIPTMLGICVYIITFSACTKLLWNDIKGRIASCVSLLLCVFMLPFTEGYILIPLIVAVCCMGYLFIKKLK